MELRWAMPAAEDLERICEWIERDNPEVVRRVAKTIYEECERLRQFQSWTRSPAHVWTS